MYWNACLHSKPGKWNNLLYFTTNFWYMQIFHLFNTAYCSLHADLLFLFLALFMNRSFYLLLSFPQVHRLNIDSSPPRQPGICSSVQLYIAALINLHQRSVIGRGEGHSDSSDFPTVLMLWFWSFSPLFSTFMRRKLRKQHLYIIW